MLMVHELTVAICNILVYACAHNLAPHKIVKYEILHSPAIRLYSDNVLS